MTTILGIEDLIVTLILAALLGLARESLRRRLGEVGLGQEAATRSRRFFLYAVSYVIVLMGCGVLHQTRTLAGRPAYVVFSALILIGYWGWRRLNRVPVLNHSQ